MIVTLYNGSNFTDMKEKQGKEEYPFKHDHFSQQTIIFQLPDISMKESNENLFKRHYEILNTSQLTVVIDSLEEEYDTRTIIFHDKLMNYNYFKHEKKSYDKKGTDKYKTDSVNKFKEPEKLISPANLDSIYKEMTNKDKLFVIKETISSLERIRINLENNDQSLYNRLKWLKKHQLAWYKKFSLSFACLVFFFIGAPLGAIIRKGGFGLPILVSVVLFMFYYVLYILGEKAASEDIVPVFIGAWLASGILFPLGVFITYKATKDSKIINIQKFEEIMKNIQQFLRLGI